MRGKPPAFYLTTEHTEKIAAAKQAAKLHCDAQAKRRAQCSPRLRAAKKNRSAAEKTVLCTAIGEHPIASKASDLQSCSRPLGSGGGVYVAPRLSIFTFEYYLILIEFFPPGTSWNKLSEPGQGRKAASLRNLPYATRPSPVFFFSSTEIFPQQTDSFFLTRSPHHTPACPLAE